VNCYADSGMAPHAEARVRLVTALTLSGQDACCTRAAQHRPAIPARGKLLLITPCAWPVGGWLHLASAEVCAPPPDRSSAFGAVGRFRLPLSIRPGRRNWAMWESRRGCGEISKRARPQEGKPAFGFPHFPHRGTSTVLFRQSWELRKDAGRMRARYAMSRSHGGPARLHR
jgi:hypothetical protein